MIFEEKGICFVQKISRSDLLLSSAYFGIVLHSLELDGSFDEISVHQFSLFEVELFIFALEFSHLFSFIFNRLTNADESLKLGYL